FLDLRKHECPARQRHRNHEDDGGAADDYPKRGQGRAQLVRAQRVNCHRQSLSDIHGRLSLLDHFKSTKCRRKPYSLLSFLDSSCAILFLGSSRRAFSNSFFAPAISSSPSYSRPNQACAAAGEG